MCSADYGSFGDGCGGCFDETVARVTRNEVVSRRRILLGGGGGREVPLILFRPSIWNKHEKGERGGQRGLATSLANTVAFTANSLCITATGISETC